MEAKRKSSYLSGGNLRVISYCPLCEAAYNPLRARVLDEHDDAHLLHIQCARCGSSIVALLMSSLVGITSVSLITDLTGDDVLKFKDAGSVTSDDVLACHVALTPLHL